MYSCIFILKLKYIGTYIEICNRYTKWIFFLLWVYPICVCVDFIYKELRLYTLHCTIMFEFTQFRLASTKKLCFFLCYRKTLCF